MEEDCDGSCCRDIASAIERVARAFAERAVYVLGNRSGMFDNPQNSGKLVAHFAKVVAEAIAAAERGET